MSKENGLGWTTLTVDTSGGSANDLRSDVTNFEFSTPRGVQDTTGVDKFAIERLLLLADFSITLNGVFDDGSNLAHVTLKTVPLAASGLRTVALGVSGQTLSNECVFTDYQMTRAQSGEFTWQAPAVLGDGTVPTWS